MANESRPGAAVEDQAGRLITPDLNADDQNAVEFFRESFAVLVRGKSVRRHLYFNLPAATRTVARARARGDHAEMVLVKLVPVNSRRLDEEATQ